MQENYKVKAYCGCAEGADLLFAEEILKCGVELVAVLPCSWREFISEHADGGVKLMRVLGQATEVLVEPDGNSRYLKVAETIIKNCDELIALWDGVKLPLKDDEGKDINLGGTYDTICRAQAANKRIKIL